MKICETSDEDAFPDFRNQKKIFNSVTLITDINLWISLCPALTVMYRQKKESWCVYDCVMLSYFRQRALTDALSHGNTLQSHELDWTLCIRRNAKCPFFDFWNIKASYLELCLTKALPIYCNVMLMLINKYNSLSVKDLFWILVPSMSIWCDVKCTRLVKTPSGFRIVLRVRFWNWENSSFVSYFCFSVMSICLCAFYSSYCRLIACFNLFFLVSRI